MVALELLAAEGPNHVTFAALATEALPAAMQAVAATISTAAIRPVGCPQERARRGDEKRFGERLMSMVSYGRVEVVPILDVGHTAAAVARDRAGHRLGGRDHPTGSAFEVSLDRQRLSPMAWLREQRLEAARTMLEHSQGMDAAAAAELVAASCGFGRLRHRGEFRLHKNTCSYVQYLKSRVVKALDAG